MQTIPVNTLTTQENSTTFRRNFKIDRPVTQIQDIIRHLYERLVVHSGREVNVTPAHLNAFHIAAQWLVEGQSWGLKIIGGVGTGKSTLMEAIRLLVNQYMKYVPPPNQAFINTFEASVIAEAFRCDNEQTSMFFQYRAVAIDDLGIEPTVVKYFGNEIMPLADIIHRRANQRKITCIVSNLDGPKIALKYGPRVYDRMRDMQTIVLDGESHRGKKFCLHENKINT